MNISPQNIQEVTKKITKTVLKIIGAIIALIILVNLVNFFTVVKAGERGVLLQFGNVKEIYQEGLHFQVPIVYSVVIMDVRTQKDEVDVGAASKDLQEIEARVALNYHADPTRVDFLYKEIGPEYQKRIISPAIQESVKAVTAKFTAEELITKRAAVKEEMRSDLTSRLDAYYILIDDLSIVDFSFSEEFDLAIEAKQTAVQQALKAENDLRRIEIEAQQKIETAKAEAESIRIQAEALKQNADLIRLKAVEQWDGVLPVYTMGNTIPLINL